ncbi:MAG: hypothetical protein ACM3SY_17195 [Candidatus Omnitrophota bacterium]
MQTVGNYDKTSETMARRKIDTLISIGAGGIVDNTLSKLIRYQLSKYRDHIIQIKCELEKFETTYHMTSEEFYQKFEAGELGDDADFFEWSGLYENVLLYRNRIQELEEDTCHP